MDKKNFKAWLYLLPAILFLGLFLVYPLIDVFIYSFEEGYNFASQTYYGVGPYNYSYVLHDTYFLQAVKNTFLLVIITVPVSTGLALLISVGLSSIKPLRELYQTIYFLPYVTNTLAVGLVFMILFQKTEYTDGLVNLFINWFGGESVDFIDGPLGEDVRALLLHGVGGASLQDSDSYQRPGLCESGLLQGGQGGRHFQAAYFHADYPADDLAHDFLSGDYGLYRRV